MTRHASNGFAAKAVAEVIAALAVCLAATVAIEAARGSAGRAVSPANAPGMVRIPAGSYRPLYKPPESLRERADAQASSRSGRTRRVDAFDIDPFPVTNGEYLGFVREHPEWRRSRARKPFVDDAYLHQWAGDLDPGDKARLDAPVVSVSWFAARAYLKAFGKQLPTVDQWEYVAAPAKPGATPPGRRRCSSGCASGMAGRRRQSCRPSRRGCVTYTASPACTR